MTESTIKNERNVKILITLSLTFALVITIWVLFTLYGFQKELGKIINDNEIKSYIDTNSLDEVKAILIKKNN